MNVKSRRDVIASLLYLCSRTVSQAGDTHPNPRPKNPCGGCGGGVRSTHKAILCDDCGAWYHKGGISSDNYTRLHWAFYKL